VATFVGVGFSQNVDAKEAAKEAAAKAKNQLGYDRIDLAIVFNTIHYSPGEFLPVLNDRLQRTRLVGCSTAGLITAQRPLLRGLGLIVLASDNIRFEAGCVNHLHLQDPIVAGKTLFKNALSDFGIEQRKIFICLADGLLNNLTDILTGVNAQDEGKVIITGAGASDNFLFSQTQQHYREKSYHNSAVGLFFGGKMLLGVSSQHGFKPLGQPHLITRAEGPIIRSIDGKKPFALYRQYFEAAAETMRTEHLDPMKVLYPLGIRLTTKNGTLLRNVLRVLDDESILCQDKIPEGAEVHLMIANQDSHLAAAAQAATAVREQLANKKPRLLLIFESLLRYRILRRAAGQVTGIIQNILGQDIPLLGMYSWGEFVTAKGITGANTFVQNGNITLVAIG
jgi:hypothetical protein